MERRWGQGIRLVGRAILNGRTAEYLTGGQQNIEQEDGRELGRRVTENATADGRELDIMAAECWTGRKQNVG